MPSFVRSLFTAAALLAPLALHAQSGAFVAKLGNDTIFIERFTRSGASIDGALLRHAPQATMTRYTLMLNANGSPAKYTQVTTKADGSPLPAGAVPQVMTFTGDSVLREIQQNGAAVTLRNAAPKGLMPAVGLSYVFAERMIQAALRGDTVYSIGFGPAAVPTKVDVRLMSRDSAEIVAGGFRTGYRIERDGRIKRGDGSLTTQKFIVTPQSRIDLDGIATAWAARDAAGQAMGAASTRDTLSGMIGTAHVTLDYGRPAKRGREIWGKLVPMDTTWRFGANAAAQFRTDKPLLIGGVAIEPGFYTLWLYPSTTQSLLIVNSQTGQWGTAYDGRKDVARIPVDRQAPRATSEERFTVTLDGDKMLMTWDRSGYVVSVKEK
jgi:hypothetical protein